MLSSLIKRKRDLDCFLKFCVCCPVDSWGLLSFVLSIGCFFVQTWVGWFRLRSSSTLLLPRGIRFLGLVYRTINAKLSICHRKNLPIYLGRFFDSKKAQGKRFSACARVPTDVAKHISPQK